jgi:hypothetical protein
MSNGQGIAIGKKATGEQCAAVESDKSVDLTHIAGI